MVRHIGFAFAILGLLVLFILLIIYGEDPLMDSLVSTGPDITVDVWRESFRLWAITGIAISTLAAWAWLVLGKLKFNMNDWSNANRKRIVWFILLVVSALAAVPGILLTPTVQEGRGLALMFYVVNNLALFYLSTLCFSASSFKYTPPFAMVVRRW